MLGHTNRRRSGRFVTTALLALVAQSLLVMVSPLADVHYHESGPLQVVPAGSHHLSQHSGLCPECLAMQTLAVPGAFADLVRTEWARAEAPRPTPVLGYAATRPTSTLARAPPSLPAATLQTL